jgi:hypothetical protein
LTPWPVISRSAGADFCYPQKRFFISPALAASGRKVSLDELSAWRNNGLLPPLASHGLVPGRAVARAMMEEARAVGEALGIRFAVSIDKGIDGAGEVGAYKISMLQDPERGRPMEIDALLGSVVEFAELTGKPDVIEKANGARPASRRPIRFAARNFLPRC